MLQGNNLYYNASTTHYSEKVDIINYFSKFIEHQPLFDGSIL